MTGFLFRILQGGLGDSSKLVSVLTILANDDPYGLFLIPDVQRPIRIEESFTSKLPIISRFLLLNLHISGVQLVQKIDSETWEMSCKDLVVYTSNNQKFPIESFQQDLLFLVIYQDLFSSNSGNTAMISL